MLSYITLLILCQLGGEVIGRGLGLPVPGSVIGMGLLFVGLCVKGGVPAALDQTAKGILTNLSLLFVPAGVGLITNLGVIGANIVSITVAVVVSTALTMVVTGAAMEFFHRRTPQSPQPGPQP